MATLTRSLLVEGLGVGGGGRDVGVTGSLVRAGGELELVGGLEVGLFSLMAKSVIRFREFAQISRTFVSRKFLPLKYKSHES